MQNENSGKITVFLGLAADEGERSASASRRAGKGERGGDQVRKPLIHCYQHSHTVAPFTPHNHHHTPPPPPLLQLSHQHAKDGPTPRWTAAGCARAAEGARRSEQPVANTVHQSEHAVRQCALLCTSAARTLLRLQLVLMLRAHVRWAVTRRCDMRDANSNTYTNAARRGARQTKVRHGRRLTRAHEQTQNSTTTIHTHQLQRRDVPRRGRRPGAAGAVRAREEVASPHAGVRQRRARKQRRRRRAAQRHGTTPNLLCLSGDAVDEALRRRVG
jgi:hypothetical protein